MATNRRNALKGGFSILGAAVGLAAASRPAAASNGDQNEARETPRPLILHGRHWRISSEDVRKGELPPAGVRMMARGEIVDKPSGGRKIGDFYATSYQLNTPGKVAGHEPGSLELHTFVFADGTLIGSGVAASSPDLQSHFAILGGTGRYSGAQGSYLARQSFVDFGGDGTATFTVALV